MIEEKRLIKDILAILYVEDGKVNKDKEWSPETLEDIAEELKSHGYNASNYDGLIPENQIALVWSVEDVMDAAENREVELTEEEARDILELVKRNHDCTIGVTWETFDYYIGELETERKNN